MSARDAVLAAIATERKTLTAELAELDKAEAAFGVKAEPTPPADPAPKPQRRRPQKRRGQTSPAAALERREALYTWLAEHDGPAGVAEARAALDFSEGQFRTAIVRLMEERRVTKEGERQFTRYDAVESGTEPPAPSSEPAGAPPVPTPPSGETGTLQGRVLNAVQSRGFATLGDLVQVTGGSSEEVLEVCGLLIRENEIHMERRNGNPGYVPV
jgi:hypothetical protein